MTYYCYEIDCIYIIYNEGIAEWFIIFMFFESTPYKFKSVRQMCVSNACCRNMRWIKIQQNRVDPFYIHL